VQILKPLKTNQIKMKTIRTIKTAFAVTCLVAQVASAQNNVTTSSTGVTVGSVPYFPTAGSPVLGNSVITQVGGSIGVGTTTPGRAFEVKTSSQNGGLRVTQAGAGYGALELNNTTLGGHNYALFSSGGANAEGAGGFGVYDYTTGADRFFINSAGSVGIGTNVPFSKFDVVGDNSTAVTANFSNTNGYKTFFMTGGAVGSYNGMVKANDNAIIWDNNTGGSNVTNGLVLAAWNSGGGMRIDATGATNINCSSTISTSPFTVQKAGVNLLQVDASGNAAATGNIVLNNNPAASPVTSAQLYIKTYGGTVPDANHGLGYFVNYNTNKGGTQTAVHIDGPVLYGWGGGALATMSAGSPTTSNIALQWNNVGQVYIGSQKPTSANAHNSALLNVSGDVVIGNLAGTAGLYLVQSSWADFVFDKNYALMPLNEVENFYKENHHLPNVPTTKEIQENGNNIGQTEVVLLQKIEELTLYIVKQQKEIDALKKQAEQTKK
jgi:hypothetical protein